MKRFTSSIQASLMEKNWYSALTTALTLPDICGYLEDPSRGSQKRYVKWFNEFQVHKYTRKMPPDQQPHVFLSGEDCYALRCSYLHQGADNIEQQRARRALESFMFVAPSDGMLIHMNQVNNKLQLQVDLFCRQMCSGVEEWITQIHDTDSGVQKRAKDLLVIHSMEGGLLF